MSEGGSRQRRAGRGHASGELTGVIPSRRFGTTAFTAALLALVLVLGACSDDDDEASADKPPEDACALVTPEEVRSALGEQVGPPTRSTQGVGDLPGTGCIYVATEAVGDAIVISRSESDRSREVFDGSRRSVGPEGVVPVDGGEDAEGFVAGETGILQKGSEIVSVVVSRSDERAAAETAKRLLEAAAKRL